MQKLPSLDWAAKDSAALYDVPVDAIEEKQGFNGDK